MRSCPGGRTHLETALRNTSLRNISPLSSAAPKGSGTRSVAESPTAHWSHAQIQPGRFQASLYGKGPLKCKTLSFPPSQSPSLALPTPRAGELGFLLCSKGGISPLQSWRPSSRFSQAECCCLKELDFWKTSEAAASLDVISLPLSIPQASVPHPASLEVAGLTPAGKLAC